MNYLINGVNDELLKGVNELNIKLNNVKEINVTYSNLLEIKNKNGYVELKISLDVELFLALKILKSNINDLSIKRRINTLSFMNDSSRNAVLNISTIKKVIRYLALNGFNELELYTEDLFEIDDPYFGHFRGRYTKGELMEIKEYAKMFGITLVPCIETLAHMNTITSQPHFYDITDTQDILLVNERKTYDLIYNMFMHIRDVFDCDIINIGMDEAHLLGAGRYLDINGYENRYEIFLKHLNIVSDIAKEYGFKSMIWSDMFFRIASNGNYYGDGLIPAGVIESVPKDVTLIYWDYDHIEKQEFDRLFNRHKLFNRNIRFTTAIWNWMGFSPNYSRSDKTIHESINSMIDMGINEFMLASWGDNGNECSVTSILPTLYEVSDLVYGINTSSFKDEFGISYDEFKTIEDLNRAKLNGTYMVNPNKYLLYNDLLLGLFDRHVDSSYSKYYFDVSLNLSKIRNKTKLFNYMFDPLVTLAKILSIKSNLGNEIRNAYKLNDLKSLKKCVSSIDEILILLDKFFVEFKNQWLIENKYNGFEIQEARLGGLISRLKGVKNRLELYLDNKLNEIEELKEEPLPYIENRDSKDIFINFYNKMISPGIN